MRIIFTVKTQDAMLPVRLCLSKAVGKHDVGIKQHSSPPKIRTAHQCALRAGQISCKHYLYFLHVLSTGPTGMVSLFQIEAARAWNDLQLALQVSCWHQGDMLMPCLTNCAEQPCENGLMCIAGHGPGGQQSVQGQPTSRAS